MKVRLDPWVIGMKQFAHRADRNDFAVGKRGDAIANGIQAGEIVCHHEDGQSECLLECPDQIIEVPRRDWVQSRCRLVEKHDGRVERERARQRNALGHSAG